MLIEDAAAGDPAPIVAAMKQVRGATATALLRAWWATLRFDTQTAERERAAYSRPGTRIPDVIPLLFLPVSTWPSPQAAMPRQRRGSRPGNPCMYQAGARMRRPAWRRNWESRVFSPKASPDGHGRNAGQYSDHARQGARKAKPLEAVVRYRHKNVLCRKTEDWRAFCCADRCTVARGSIDGWRRPENRRG